jgi:L-xylulose 5-phosphate 3-epimerase (EC 5.1.3.22)
MKPYSLGVYEKAMPNALSWKEKMTVAKELGYDYIEMSIDESDEKLNRLNMNKQERKDLVMLMYETGMPIRSICLSGHRRFPLGSSDKAIRTRALDIMEKAIELACDLGIRTIQLAGYDVYYEESSPVTRQYFIENLKIANEIAAKEGVLLGFETMETCFMDTVVKAMAYVQNINSPYLAIYPDSGNLVNASHLYNNDVYKDIIIGSGHIIALHLKESLPGKYREVAFGTGHVDFEKIIDTAWSIGVRRYVTELWYTGQDNWKDIIRDAHDRMDRILNQKAQC